jgi:hypothetical protein
MRESNEESDLLDGDAEIPDSGGLEDGGGLAASRGVYYQMGDLVELVQANFSGTPNLAVFVRNISESSSQAQLITQKGEWISVSRGTFTYTVQGFLDPKVVAPILPYLPTEELVPQKLDQAIVFDVSVPRQVSAPIITALTDFANKAEEVYRQNAACLDDAHKILSHATDLRFGSIHKITHKLLGVSDPPEHVLYAVRRALLRADIGFGIDRKSHRTTGMFQIRSQEQVKLIAKVQKWLRNYQEWKIVEAAQKSFPPGTDPSPSKLDLEGVEFVRGFIEKCRVYIPLSRKDRPTTNGGCLGPTKDRFSLKSKLGAIRKEDRAVFSIPERSIIRFLEFWCLQNLFSHSEALLALAPLVIRDTGFYEDFVVDRSCAYMFLMEIGVMEPFTNRVHFDVNLLLPSSQHSKPLEQLAASLAKLGNEDTNLLDSMADLRHDFKNLPVYCIDSEDAQEIDDGISVERIDGTPTVFWVHIHIANPTAFVRRDSVFAKMAAHLTESFYSPEKIYPMLPEWMSRQLFSLGSKRPTLTFSAKLNQKADILRYKIQPGFIRNVVRLAYSDLPSILGERRPKVSKTRLVVGGDPPRQTKKPYRLLSEGRVADIELLQSLSVARYKYRRSQGGVYYQPTNADVSVFHKEGEFGLPTIYPRRKHGQFTNGDPVIEIHPEPYKNWFDASGGANSDHLVREMMMLAGEVAARFAADRDVPIIYRGMQPNPYSKRTAKEYEHDVLQPAVEKYGGIPLQIGQQLVVNYGRSAISADPIRHPLMGLNNYSKISSPLRRYGDMITHWQIEATLREEARVDSSGSDFDKDNLAFTKSQINTMISSLQPRERLIMRAKHTCRLHWITQFYFRAFNFNELDLPRRFNIVIDMHQPNHMRTSAGRFTYGITMAHGVRVSIQPLAPMEFWETVRVGDIWEVEIKDVVPYLVLIDVHPLRLVKREME